MLTIKLTEQEKARRARKEMPLEAYDYYLRGRDYLNRLDKSSNAQARSMLEKAVEIDPQYSLAYSALGHTYLLEWTFGWSQDAGSIDRAFGFALKSMALEDSSPNPHELLGNIYLWRNEQAIAELRIAISLDPNNAVIGLRNSAAFYSGPGGRKRPSRRF